MTEMKPVIKNVLKAAVGCGILLTALGFNAEDFSIRDLAHYRKEFQSYSVGACSASSVKSYEDYRMITDDTSPQYWHIRNHMTVDEETGLLYDEDGFIGVALGYRYGVIGSRFYIELDTGITIPVVKIDEKAAADAPDGCKHDGDSSVVEFVLDSDRALAYFGSGNGYVANGNLNNIAYFNGHIIDVEAVTSTKVVLESGVTYEDVIQDYIRTDEEVEEDMNTLESGY